MQLIPPAIFALPSICIANARQSAGWLAQLAGQCRMINDGGFTFTRTTWPPANRTGQRSGIASTLAARMLF